MIYRKTKNAYTGRNNKLLLDTKEAFSYNWWKYVSKENGIVIFNNYNYSSTTNGHQCETRGLLKKHKIKVSLTVYTRASLHDSAWKHEEITRLNEIIFLAQYRMTKKGVRKDAIKEMKSTIKDAEKQLKRMAKFKVTMTKNDLKALRESVVKNEDYRLQSNREKAAKAKAIRDAQKLEHAAELNDLSPVTIFDTMDKVNDLNAI